MTIVRSVLLVGESDVGKTHYGAQILRRLNSAQGAFELLEAANLKPFKSALERISQGLSAPHTPRAEYSESSWRLRHRSDSTPVDLIWPDYGGEQVTAAIDEKLLPASWHKKINCAFGWIFMVRPSHIPLPEDVLTRAVSLPAVDQSAPSALSPQSKTIELLQMLLYKRRAYRQHEGSVPPLAVLLSCYDELKTKESPADYCAARLPMLAQFLSCNWPRNRLRLFGVSPLGQALSQNKPDEAYAASGPEKNGFVIDEAGIETDDLLAPLEWLISASAAD